MSEAIPAAAREVLRLFDEHLADRSFGDLDAAALEALAEITGARAEDVGRARQALDAALTALEDARAALVRRTEQALAYARIHALDDEALATALASLDAARGPSEAKRQKPKKRRAAPPDPIAPARPAELPFEAARAG